MSIVLHSTWVPSALVHLPGYIWNKVSISQTLTPTETSPNDTPEMDSAKTFSMAPQTSPVVIWLKQGFPPVTHCLPKTYSMTTQPPPAAILQSLAHLAMTPMTIQTPQASN